MLIQHNLYNFLKLIPENKVVTYKDLAELFATSPRNIANLLSKNNDPEIPCYKVVQSNKHPWGYNLWYNEKIKRLQNSGIKIDENNKIQTKFFWKVNAYNYFIAFPMDDYNKDNFKDFQKHLKSDFWKKNIIYQNPKSPHITIKFIWELSKENLPSLVSNLEEYFQKDFLLRNQTVSLDILWNFNWKVYYLTCYKDQKNLLKSYLKNFNHFLGLPKDKREREPHITVFKYKWLKPLKEDKIQAIFAKYRIWININTVRVYTAVNWIYQIPLIDINLS